MAGSPGLTPGRMRRQIASAAPAWGRLRLPTDINAGTPQPGRRGHFSSDMFGVLGDRGSRRALLAGFLSQEQHFGSLEAHLEPQGASLSLWANGDGARLDPEAQIETDWACLYFLYVDNPDPLGPYLEAVRRQAGLAGPSTTPIPSGWCSWYQFSSETTYHGAVERAGYPGQPGSAGHA